MPKGPGRPPKPGGPNRQWNFRPTPEAKEFVEGMAVQDSISKTAAVLRCLQYVREAREMLGDDWYEMERQARVEGLGVGAVLGRLAKAALEKGRRK